MINANLYSFKINNLFAPRYYRVLEVVPDFRLVEQPDCPCDRTRLRTIAVLIGNAGRKRIRVGCCPDCGYVGYIDRPTREWISEYYSDTWDTANQKNSGLAAEVEKWKTRTGSPGRVGEAARRLGVDKKRFILEIGAGQDLVFRGLEEMGYKKIIAVDNSKYRAQISEQAFGIKVLPHPFEHPEAQSELRNLAPFGLIFSSHVLEHTYDPAEIVRLCAGLQRQGDWLMLALPNVVKERAGMTFLYLPHLHGLRPASLAALVERCGYRVAEQSPPDAQNFIIARRRSADSASSPKISPRADYFQDTLERMAGEIGLGRSYRNRFRLWWWFKRIGLGGQERLWSRFGPMPRLQYYFCGRVYFRRKYRNELIAGVGPSKYQKRTAHLSSIMGAAIEDIQRRCTAFQESPIEIQFDGNIKLFYK